MASGNQQSTQEINERIRNLKFQPGDLIAGRYEYVCEVGHYSMGVVLLCHDRNAGGHPVVVKTVPDVLRHDEAEAQALMQEFDIVYRLKHDSIPAIRSLVEDENRFYVVMDYAPGMMLEAYLIDHPQSSPEIVLEVIRRVASALDYAHGKGMVHQNVKPSKVLVDIDNKGTVKSVGLLDFALGRQIRESFNRATGSKAVTGSLSEYKAPEQWKNQQTAPATDQYALAVMAYEMLAGRSPLNGGSAEALRKAVLEETPQRIEGVSDAMNDALMTALSKDPSQRYASCKDFVRAMSGETVAKVAKAAVPKPQDNASSGKGKGKLIAIAAAAAAVIVILAVLAVVLLSGKKSDKPVDSVATVPPKSVTVESEKTATASKPAEKTAETKKEADSQSPEAAKLKQEVLLQQSAIGRMQLKLSEEKIDRAHTFGTHLDAFGDQSKAGNAAIGRNEYAVAALCFEAAQKEFAWLEANIKPRKEATSKFSSVYAIAYELNKNGANKYAAEAYEKAVKVLEEGRLALTAGEFAKSMELFGTAQGMLETMTKEVRSTRLAELVAEAKKLEAAGTEEDWKKIYKLAQEMKGLDNELAQEWLTKADVRLPSTLLLVAKVDGQEVDASIDGTAETTPWTSPVLTRGKKESHYLSWWKGNEEYVAEVTETVDWRGRKERVVELRKKVLNLRNGWLMLPGNLKMDLVKVERGTFEMGSGKYSDEKPIQVVITRDYWIGKYEVTQAQWKAMDLNKKRACYWEGDSLPVENVTWNEAMAFCEQLNQLAKGQLPDGYRFSLPTEAEWEFAARGGNKSRGYEFSGGNNLEKVGWYWNNSGQRTHPVKGKKSKLPNELGIYDMSGNVWEWCRDSCDFDPKNLKVKTASYEDGVEDPLSRQGTGRVARGGSWHGSIGICRTVYRGGNEQSDMSFSHLGFRIALSPVR